MARLYFHQYSQFLPFQSLFSFPDLLAIKNLFKNIGNEMRFSIVNETQIEWVYGLNISQC